MSIQEFSLIEHFSGIGMLADVFKDTGYAAAEIDKIHGRGCDILKDSCFGYLALNSKWCAS